MDAMTLTSRELAALQTITDPATLDEPGPVFSWALLDAVRCLVDADEVELEQTDPKKRWLGFLMALGSHSYVDDEPDDPHFWELFWSTDACARTADPAAPPVTLLSDHLTDREWRESAIWREYTGDTRLFHSLVATLPDPRGHLIRLHCWRRAGRDFTDRHRFLLNLVRPHLAEAYRTTQWHRPHADLTTRQLELLEHVRRGLTNRQIARAMGLSENTVRRHLSNIYERLDARSRTEAVTRALSATPR